MNSRQRKTLAAIFFRPTKSDIEWAAIESLFKALGASIAEGRGSRVRISLRGAAATFHRPHPKPQADQGLVDNVRKFLQDVGVEP
ncbi:MAG: type II toxin-antitoxin system HicA family toxin [Desulfovibrionaceae bacterium]